MNKARKLPAYAATANAARLVWIFCKGYCARSSWAEMDAEYPGQEVLRRSQVGDFRATCLRCGGTAFDCYKWERRSFTKNEDPKKPYQGVIKQSRNFTLDYLASLKALAERQKACLSRLESIEKRLGIPQTNLVSREYRKTLFTIHKIQAHRLACEKEEVCQRLDKQIQNARLRLEPIERLLTLTRTY